MERVYSVSQISRYLKGALQQDPLLQRISVSGEVSNVKFHTSGHLYFTLKDAGGALPCVMFSRNRRGLSFAMANGDKVVVTGSVDFYERDGRVQLYATAIRREGIGELYERFEALRRELAERGMFDAMYKKPIPRFALRVGVVTAATGAAIRDIQNICRRRNPYVKLFLYPALVQGEGAKSSIARGLRAMDRLGVDVIIVGRGGGSLEDLWAFNEEEVAEAIFECETPVISAVGHETDTTIADYVADLRAPTPSAAAELAVFDYRKLEGELSDMQSRLKEAVLRKARLLQMRARLLDAQLRKASPRQRLASQMTHAMDLEDALAQAMDRKLQSAQDRVVDFETKLFTHVSGLLTNRQRELARLAGRFEGLSPLARLRQGFSFTADSEGRAVTRISQVRPGDSLTIHVRDGNILASVNETKKHELFS